MILGIRGKRQKSWEKTARTSTDNPAKKVILDEGSPSQRSLNSIEEKLYANQRNKYTSRKKRITHP